ncbi:MAG TPA: mechanosensitive ion channel family protein [Thermoanaerobaculia bacterium]|nr:mechanosensitive ion channel family protein [Thermoanaerobaculia bacterium]
MRAALCLAALCLAAGALLAQVPASGEAPPEDAPAFDFEPLLPSEGLFERDTWVLLGRRLLMRAVDYLPSLVAAVLVLVLFFLLSGLVTRVLGGVLRRSRGDPALAQILLPLVRYAILGLGLIMAASQAGLAVGSLLAGVGVAGIAIGLAAQDSLGNVVAGFTILWDRPFRIGDRVTVAETYGQVMQIGLRSTRLRTLEQLDVILPNKEVINNVIVNHTLTPNLRLGVPLSIAYGADIREARQVLLAAVEDHPKIHRQPEPQVVVTELGDNGVHLELRVFLQDAQDERQVLFALFEVAKLALDEAGIEIPFPQRTLHISAKTPPLPVAQRIEPAD